eukprot:3143670-Prymnesium_polylepis.1
MPTARATRASSTSARCSPACRVCATARATAAGSRCMSATATRRRSRRARVSGTQPSKRYVLLSNKLCGILGELIFLTSTKQRGGTRGARAGTRARRKHARSTHDPPGPRTKPHNDVSSHTRVHS